MQSQEALSVLQFAFLPALHPLLPDWHSRATAEEQQGVRVLAAVLKHKGLKVFRARPRQQSAARLVTSYMQSFEWQKPVTPLREMLHYRQISELEYSSVLNPQALEWIQRWILLEDQDRYLSLLMTALRSIYTCFRGTHTRTMTTNKASYHVYSHSDLLRASQLRRVRQKPAHSASFCRPKKGESLPQTRLASPTRFISAGKPKPVTWFGVSSQGSLVTSYQDSFKSHYFKGRNPHFPREQVSLSITLSPYREM